MISEDNAQKMVASSASVLLALCMEGIPGLNRVNHTKLQRFDILFYARAV
jgi:hypothetical protein